MTAPTQLANGEIFADRYEVEGLLGRGGMGAVYRARDLSLGESIALKLLATDGEAAPAEVLRFRQEVRLARRVTHPNVARVYDIGEHAGVVYLTMELVDGETLRALLRRERRLAPPRAARIALALCEGLRAAHAAGVVHRDLKPANVLVDRQGRIVITDFGIARSLTEASGLTVGIVGTPSYMAPEQLFGGLIDARTDIYALGLLVQEMLTGERAQGTSPRLDEHPALAELLQRCTAPMAAARPASVEEVARALTLAVPDAAAVAPAPGAAAGAPELERDADTRALAPAPITVARATLAAGAPALAVLPFRYRGPSEQEYFGDAITDELVDVLSRTRGVRVLGSGATARYREARDPRTIGADLGATAIIDGTVQLAGGRVRITARLLETTDGVQIWTERYDRDLGDLFELQETIGRRVAEELRVELATLSHRGAAPAPAIELYLAGRHRLRAFDFDGAAAAAAGLASCLDLAPDFTPAFAAHAIATLRCWYYDTSSGAVDWESAARASVARALERASDLAEAHLAAGILATHVGDYRSAARAIERALAIAPTYAEAHEYLGMLQCEAGRADDGVKRLRLAGELDPTLVFCNVFLARYHALHGQYDLHDATIDAIDRHHGPAVERLTTAQRVRSAAWRGDREALRRLAAVEPPRDSPNWHVVRLYARALAGELSLAEVHEGFTHIFSATHNPRYLALATQLATEVYAGLGLLDEARFHLLKGASSGLVDVEWIERCPMLAPLRTLPDWPEARRRVRARAEAVWTT